MSANRILVKLRPSAALRAAESRADLRPLRVPVPGQSTEPFGLSPEPRWFVADLPDGAASPWDAAHVRIADQLGVAESDIEFAEPDLVHDIYRDDSDTASSEGAFAAAPECVNDSQTTKNGRPTDPKDGWHLRNDYSQLARARESVDFSGEKIRIAHFDTGYYAPHVTTPKHLRKDLERNFVDRGRGGDATDPDNKRFVLDNSGHGTGTIGILAGQASPAAGDFILGGAPDAEIVPLRIADSVVLLNTSTFASALDYAVDIGCDVGTMSMGGLPTRAWRESVDRAYISGFCMVAAAGNNSRGLPTRHIVYPARYGRVIAACGVMANNAPYADLKGGMEGNFGPDHVMNTAMAAFTPNIPWARFGCPDAVRMNGEGTSSATPQVAAAAALWYQKYRNALPRDWRRVEAVRHALFSSTKTQGAKKEKLGKGILAAFEALAVAPRLDLKQTKSDGDRFAFLRVLTGLGITDSPPREQMFNLELMQLWLRNKTLQELVPNPEAATPSSVDRDTLAKIMDTVIADERASQALRKHLIARYPSVRHGRPRPTKKTAALVPSVMPACDEKATPVDPPHRRLRIYASDPSFATKLDTVGINAATLNVPWESIEPGPVGEYLDVIDQDPSGRKYPRVDLDDPRLLAQDGWAPSEGNAQFHQQMTYAVAMTTIAHFERALGRPVLWRPQPVKGNPKDDSRFTQRLTIQPHALRQANAFYSPTEIALKFGYFEATNDTPGELVPGSRVYTCLSHDIVAHETTHAILDGMHRRFAEATNIDTLALHEAFADIVSLFQHFTLRDLLRAEIARTRGDLESESILGSLAVQFGNAIGGRGALRDAIGRMVNGKWQRIAPDPSELPRRVTPHARGAILVAAVFDAFLAIYKTRTADLLRIYTGGTGVLPAGALHPDLVHRLADEAAKTAEHVLTMCIRALDYVPPVDVTFFEYLRGIITADFDLVPDDRYGYRVAFVEAFRRRGIYAISIDSADQEMIRTLSVDTLRWRGVEAFPSKAGVQEHYLKIINGLREHADASLYYTSREQLFQRTHERRKALHKELTNAFAKDHAFAKELGIAPGRPFEVHELRRASRMGDDGKYAPQLIIALTQSEDVPAQGDKPAFKFRSGSTLVVDLGRSAVKYRIFKSFDSETRRARTAALAQAVAADPLRKLLAAPDQDEPFAVLHGLLDTQE